MFYLIYIFLEPNAPNGCEPGWETAEISAINTQFGYHEFANTSRAWCIKLIAESTGKDDLCVAEGTTRITFGEGRTSFAAAFIELVSQKIGKE